MSTIKMEPFYIVDFVLEMFLGLGLFFHALLIAATSIFRIYPALFTLSALSAIGHKINILNPIYL